MAFFKFRTRGPQANEGRNISAAAPAESVETLRRRARHRLIGAAVLVLLGVIGFPLLFDTQPRPVAVDIPIEIPDRAKVEPLKVPATAAAPAPSSAPTAATVASAKPPDNAPRSSALPRGGAMITESADGTEIPAGKNEVPAPRTESKPVVTAAAPAAVESRPEVKVEPKPAPKPEPKPAPKPEPKPAAVKPEPTPAPVKPAPSTASDDGARARALLDGKSPAAAKAAATDDAGRFIVQVGAFADADKAREVRQKLERAGLKTSVSVAKTADGERTRVRVGPFSSRSEAERAAGKVKGLSLAAAVLSL